VNEIRRVLKLAAWRLLVIDLFHTFAVMLSAAVAALILTLLVERIFGVAIQFPADWVRLAGIALGAAVIGSIVWSSIRRARGITVARELDERADLRESLSTAMCVASSQDAWARVVVETARDKATKVDVRRAIPYVAPRLWPVPLALALSMVVLWFSVPHWDVLGALKSRAAQKDEQNRITEVKAEVKKDEQALKELMKQAKVDLKDDEATTEANEQNVPLTPDEIRRAAVKKLTTQVDKLGEMKAGDKAKQLDAIKQAMKQLKQPGPGPMENLSKALQKGDFAKAQEQLDELSKQMGENSMSPEDKAKAQEQMKKLAEQLDKLSKDRQNLEKQLQQAGMNKEQAQKAASNPEEMKKALEDMKNMSEGEKQELMKNAMAQMGACKQCEGMGEKMGKMAKNMGKEGMGQEGQQAMEAMAGQLNEMEQMDADMEALDAAMNEAMKQLAKMGGQCQGSCNGEGEGECEGGEMAGMSQKQSPWKAGESAGKQGNGLGGPGQAWGARGKNDTDAPVNIEKVKSPTKQGSGPIIGSRLVYGDQVRGESVAEFSQVIEASAKAATESIEGTHVSRELQGTVKHYFGRLEAKAKAQQAETTKESK
jgi:hypothetical protein